MDTRMIEVALGLVLVFAITSLVVTTLHEIWISFRGSRGDNLLMAVCSIVGDDQVTVGQMRRRLSKRYAPSLFTQKLLAHPLLVSQVLGGKKDGNLPSYLSADVFVSALIAQLCSQYTGNAKPPRPREWVNAVQAGATTAPGQSRDDGAPKAELVTSLTTLAQGVDDDWRAYEARLCAWYDSVMERAGGWFRRDTQLRLGLFGLGVAAVININPLVIAPRLWNDPVLRATVANVAGETGKALAAANAASGATAAEPSASAVDALVREIRKANDARRPTPAATAATAASSPAPTAPAKPESLEVDQALRALKESLFAAAASPHTHANDTTPSKVQNALTILLDMQDQLQIRRRASAQSPDDPAPTFASSAIIEGHLARLELALKQAIGDHAVPQDQVERLLVAVHDERRSLLPPNAQPRGLRSAAALQRACLPSEDPGAQAVCRQVDALQSLNGIGLPIGWAWANWPGCDARCQARHAAGTPAPAASASAPSDAYADAMAKDALAWPRPAWASTPASGAGTATGMPIGARELAQAYVRARAALGSASASRPSLEGLLSRLSDDDFLNGLFNAAVGWLIMAIAATLGAPFWFDLLGKLTKLRGSGATGAPATGGGGGGDSPPGSNARGGTLTASAPPPPPPPPLPQPAGGAPVPGGPGPGSSPSAAAGGDTGALTPAERELDGAAIVRVQGQLGLTGAAASGRFDQATRSQIQLWQQARQQAVTGELDATQVGMLRNPPPVASLAPPPAASGRSRTPVRSDGVMTVLREEDVRALYGDIDTEPLPGQTGFARVVTPGQPGRAQHRVVPLAHEVIDAKGGQQQVHALALPHFKAVLDAINAAGLKDRVKTCDGTYVVRHIGCDTDKPLSRHSWGLAIDINAAQNGLGREPAAQGVEGSVLELVPIFEKFGFAWGGHFSTGADGMHFELALRDPSQPPVA